MPRFSSRPWWPHVLILLAISITAAWIVNVARPEPLPWWADFTVKKSEETLRSGIKVLTVAEALAAKASGTYLFVDARDPEEFAAGHIPGAMNIPADALAMGMDDVSGLAKDRPLLIYCGGVSCDKSDELAKALKSLGFTNLAEMPEGIEGWQAAGGPVEVK